MALESLQTAAKSGHLDSPASFNTSAFTVTMNLKKMGESTQFDQNIILGMHPTNWDGPLDRVWLRGSTDEVMLDVNWDWDGPIVAGSITPLTWYDFAIRGYNDTGGQRVLKVDYRVRGSTGSWTTATIPATRGGAPTLTNAVMTLLECYSPNDSFGGPSLVAISNVRVWTAALSDADIAAELASATVVRTLNLAFRNTMNGKASVAACAVREAGTMDFTVTGPDLVLNDAANPSYGSAPLVTSIVATVVNGHDIQVTGTYTGTTNSFFTDIYQLDGITPHPQGLSSEITLGSSGPGTFSYWMRNPGPGVYRPGIILTGPPQGALTMVSAGNAVEIFGVSGTGYLPIEAPIAEVKVQPETVSIEVGTTLVLTLVDELGVAVPGLLSEARIMNGNGLELAPVATRYPGNGQAAFVAVAVGTATIVRLVYLDPISNQELYAERTVTTFATPVVVDPGDGSDPGPPDPGTNPGNGSGSGPTNNTGGIPIWSSVNSRRRHWW